MPLGFVVTLSEHLLELVDHDQQPRLPLRAACFLRGRGNLGQSGLPCAQREPSRISSHRTPDHASIGSGESRHLNRKLTQREHGRG